MSYRHLPVPDPADSLGALIACLGAAADRQIAALNEYAQARASYNTALAAIDRLLDRETAGAHTPSKFPR